MKTKKEILEIGDDITFFSTGYVNGEFKNKPFLQSAQVIEIMDEGVKATDGKSKAWDFIAFSEIVEVQKPKLSSVELIKKNDGSKFYFPLNDAIDAYNKNKENIGKMILHYKGKFGSCKTVEYNF